MKGRISSVPGVEKLEGLSGREFCFDVCKKRTAVSRVAGSVTRTIADLDDKIDITPEHVSEAIQYRTFDRPLWV
jgi:predicted ATPase with chaperone activity